MLRQFCTSLLAAAFCVPAGWALEHISLDTRAEYLNFGNSLQKEYGYRYALGVSGNHAAHALRLQYERTQTTTLKPPLSEDLAVDKIAARYRYAYDKKLQLIAGFMTIDDNLAPTDEGRIYSAGLRYRYDSSARSGFTLYKSDYDTFDVYQGDLLLEYSMPLDALKLRLTGILKGIWLDGKNSTAYTRNAENAYLTPGFRLHAVYKNYHGGIGAFFGKRLFGVMENGMRVQHHAMEIDRNYMAGIGKRFGATILMLQYVYMRATELPLSNPGVTVDNTMLRLQHQF